MTIIISLGWVVLWAGSAPPAHTRIRQEIAVRDSGAPCRLRGLRLALAVPRLRSEGPRHPLRRPVFQVCGVADQKAPAVSIQTDADLVRHCHLNDAGGQEPGGQLRSGTKMAQFIHSSMQPATWPPNGTQCDELADIFSCPRPIFWPSPQGDTYHHMLPDTPSTLGA